MKIKRFSQFLSESITATPRVGIQHLDKLTPIKFLELVKIFNDEFKGVLKTNEIKVSEKVDGSSIRFGLDPKGKFFIESSYSGPLFKSGDFTNYVISRGYQPDELSQNFENLFLLLKQHKPLYDVLKKHNTPNGIKVIGEMFYNPMAKVDDNKLKFVYIKYDKSKLANILTVIPFSTLPPEKAVELFEDLYKISNKDIRFDRLPQLKTSNLDISFQLKKT